MTDGHALILAGGFGTRLWPFSRQECPKQFLPVLGGNRSLLQETVNRLLPVFPYERIWVIAKPEHREKVLSQLPQLSQDRLLLEPVAKGTLAAISWAARYITDRYGDVPMGAFPTDHFIPTVQRFQETIQIALNWATEHDQLVVFGIQPTRAEPNYGYIEKGITLETLNGQEVVNVASFHEKPSIVQAEQYIHTGQFLWNSGIFVFRSQTLLRAVKLHVPALNDLLNQMTYAFEHSKDGPSTALEKIYERMPDSSIDKGLVERMHNIVVLPCKWKWSDIGLWGTCYGLSSKDEAGNVLSGNVFQKECSDCLVRNEEAGLIAMVGVNDMVVVHKGDVILICPKDRLSSIPELLQDLQKNGLDKFL
ncbi:MAG: sugar phosphate nucleotidyltransferase [Dissulfuribacterales bacterium]